DVAARSRAIGADDAEIDKTFTHYVTRGVVDDDRMRNAVLGQLPSSKPSPLIARPSLIDPDMERDAVVMRAVDRSECRPPIDAGKPAGLAMSQNIDLSRFALAPVSFGDQPLAMLANCAVHRDVRFSDFARLSQRRSVPQFLWQSPQHALHLGKRPA